MKIRSLRMIEHFLAAHRQGSFHAAARYVGMTQTAITKSIRELENTMGAPLFDRSVAGVKLTFFGEQFQRRAIQIEQQSDFLEREFAEMISGNSGCLRIGAGTVWSDAFLPGLMAGFTSSRPTMECIIRRGTGTQFSRWLEDGEIDIGVGLEPSIGKMPADIVFEPLLKIDTLFLVSEDHPLTQTQNSSLSDVVNYPLAMYRLDSIILDRMRGMFLQRGLDLPQPSFLADSSFSIMDFVAKTQYITCLPAPVLSMAKRHGLSSLKDISGPGFLSGAVYMEASKDYPLVKAFLTTLREFAGVETD